MAKCSAGARLHPRRERLCRIGRPALAARSGAPRQRGRRRLGVAVALAAHRLLALLVGHVAVDHHPPQEQHLPEILPVGAEAGRAVAALAGPGAAAGRLRAEAWRADIGEQISGSGHAVRRKVERIVRLDEVGELRPPAPPLLVFLLWAKGGVEPGGVEGVCGRLRLCGHDMSPLAARGRAPSFSRPERPEAWRRVVQACPRGLSRGGARGAIGSPRVRRVARRKVRKGGRTAEA